jgi:DNA-binding NarL/FixJ family response regulator
MQQQPSLDQHSASSIQALLMTTQRSHRGIPLVELAQGCRALQHSPLVIDMEAARAIGVPVVVLRSPSPAIHRPVFEKLSPREQDVARLVALGLPNSEIARRLGISLGTVKDHVHHSLAKTGMKKRTQLAAALAREGI